MRNGIKKNGNGSPDRLEELSRLMGELAHEIKNPLSTIKVNLKLVKEELEGLNFSEHSRNTMAEGDAMLKRALRKIGVIEKETSRLEQIVGDFLRYADKTQLQLTRVDVNDLVGDMIDFYSPQAFSRSITVRQGLCREPLFCKADSGVIKQAILNLFINAQQAMDIGGELLIRTDRQNNFAVIQISDTGIGIAPDRLPSIFSTYYSSRPDGSGLGLATTKKIIDAHNGTITVDSEPGRGTSFTIRLPMIVDRINPGEVSA